VTEKMQRYNDRTLMIAQIETERGLENVDAIAAVDGIDVLWVGHFDLSNFMGIPAQFDHPEFVKSNDACGKSSSKTRKDRWIHGDGYSFG